MVQGVVRWMLLGCLLERGGYMSVGSMQGHEDTLAFNKHSVSQHGDLQHSFCPWSEVSILLEFCILGDLHASVVADGLR